MCALRLLISPSICAAGVASRGTILLKATVNSWRGLCAAPRRTGAGEDPSAREGPARRRIARRRSPPLLLIGVSPRAGAAIDPGGPAFHYPLQTKERVWAENLPKLYAQAVAAQWNPQTAINWDETFELDEEVEQAVAQVMTYLIENENAALQSTRPFHRADSSAFSEGTVLQLLTVQVADEGRHVEVFTRRATLQGVEMGLSRSERPAIAQDATRRA